MNWISRQGSIVGKYSSAVVANGTRVVDCASVDYAGIVVNGTSVSDRTSVVYETKVVVNDTRVSDCTRVVYGVGVADMKFVIYISAGNVVYDTTVGKDAIVSYVLFVVNSAAILGVFIFKSLNFMRPDFQL